MSETYKLKEYRRHRLTAQAIALEYLRQGARVSINHLGTPNEDALLKSINEDAAEIVGASEQGQERLLTVAGDITQPDTGKGFIEKTVDAFGRLDVFVSNAGVCTFRDFLEYVFQASTRNDMSLVADTKQSGTRVASHHSRHKSLWGIFRYSSSRTPNGSGAVTPRRLDYWHQLYISTCRRWPADALHTHEGWRVESDAVLCSGVGEIRYSMQCVAAGDYTHPIERRGHERPGQTGVYGGTHSAGEVRAAGGYGRTGSVSGIWPE